jgi:hypothetical protein
MKQRMILMLVAVSFAFSPYPALAWWQFATNGPNSERRTSPHFSSQKECERALKATEALMAKKFPDRFPLVGSCEEYR